MALSTYKVAQLIISFGGVPLKGFARGSSLLIVPNGDSFTLTVGNDGEGVRSATGNDSHRMTITLQQTSKSNLYLSTIHTQDKEADNGAGVGIFAASDLSGSSVFMASEAWIVKPTEQGFEDESKDRVWIFETVKPDLNIVGGN